MDLVLSMKFITLGVGTAGSLAVVRRQRQNILSPQVLQVPNRLTGKTGVTGNNNIIIIYPVITGSNRSHRITGAQVKIQKKGATL